MKENDFFILGVSDSACNRCCDSEPLLSDIYKKAKDKSVISYPDKVKKKGGKKVIVRKEIPVVRLDVANKELMADFQRNGY